MSGTRAAQSRASRPARDRDGRTASAMLHPRFAALRYRHGYDPPR